MTKGGGRPNILLLISDQERHNGWLPPGVPLRWRDRLRAEGLEFSSFWAHSLPCSPSRASLMTGRYVPQHGVPDNIIMPDHAELDPAVPTLGHMLRNVGYRASYLGKWHLSRNAHPNMEAYGFSDWEGNDRHFMGLAGTGVHFDPWIADNAAHWLRRNAASLDHPWFLTVALVNPHDVMWYPIDQPFYARRNPEEYARIRELLAAAAWKDDDPLPLFTGEYEEVFDRLPPNFHDDLELKPRAQRQWQHDQQNGLWGYLDPKDEKAWLRQLDYYLELHRLGDENLGKVLGALEESGAWDDTVIMFTSDHGDMGGGHQLRSKGPFVYDEVLRVPLYVRAPGLTSPGSRTGALATHVDLAATIASLAGAAGASQLPGADLTPVLRDPSVSPRDYVLFAMDCAHTHNLNRTRYAIRGFFDGRRKYARYYGMGGGIPAYGLGGADPGHKLHDVNAPFEDQEHELYDLHEDPYELANLAADRGRPDRARREFERLRELELEEL